MLLAIQDYGSLVNLEHMVRAGVEMAWRKLFCLVIVPDTETSAGCVGAGNDALVWSGGS